MAEEFQIEKNVPIPSKVNGPDGKYSVFLKMEVGDSVFLAGINRNKGGRLLQEAKMKTNWVFTLRTVEGGIRIWRLT